MPSDPSIQDEEFAKRRVHCMVAFIHPFRLVEGPQTQQWAITIEDVNRGNWDYAALSEVVGGVDVGLPEPYHLVVCRDGGVALPPLPELRSDQAAVEFFNRCFAAMLLGGVYCEAIGLDFLDLGSIIDWRYLRVHTNSMAATNRFHNSVRQKHASPYDAIALLSPTRLPLAELNSAVLAGRGILNSVPELSGEFLLKGVTGIARRDWGVALSNLWIVVEQITSALWRRHVMEVAASFEPIPGRIDQLRDTRVWTTAARHELLLQIGVLPPGTLSKLAIARRARNSLAHSGTHPTNDAAQAAYGAVVDLLSIAVPDVEIPIVGLDLTNHSLSDPFRPPEAGRIEPTHWMELPQLPGEAELTRLEAEHRSGIQKTV